jgi:uridine kinase
LEGLPGSGSTVRITDSVDSVLERLAAVEGAHGVVIVGISGFGGSGKSTLAAALADVLQAPTVSTDEFATKAVMQPSDDWNGIDRARLIRQILVPLRQGARRIAYESSGDWEAWTTVSKTLELAGNHFIVEGVGLFHPNVLPLLDLTVWIDINPGESTRRGLARDAQAGQDDRSIWNDVWAPNDLRFAEVFDPKAHADVVIDAQ